MGAMEDSWHAVSPFLERVVKIANEEPHLLPGWIEELGRRPLADILGDGVGLIGEEARKGRYRDAAGLWFHPSYGFPADADPKLRAGLIHALKLKLGTDKPLWIEWVCYADRFDVSIDNGSPYQITLIVHTPQPHDGGFVPGRRLQPIYLVRGEGDASRYDAPTTTRVARARVVQLYRYARPGPEEQDPDCEE